MAVKIIQVDAFTSEPFRGNPAAVCILSQSMDDTWMQNVAMEMNLSETAFLLREGRGYRLRWFTPAAEVELCGHATLASAHVLWEEGYLSPEETARFATLSGELTAERDGDFICMDFPCTEVEQTPADASSAVLSRALGCRPIFLGRSAFDFFVEVADERLLRRLHPDMAALTGLGTRGVIVTASGEQHDFVSRFFAPGLGIPEDPVTGSAHCALAPYWAERLGKKSFTAFQASKRGGELGVELVGDRVRLKGQAVTTLRAELCV